MFTDSILFGEECQIGFFAYPNSLKMYDTDLDCLEFINDANRIISISCFCQQPTLDIGESGKFINTEKKKFKYSTKN